MQTSCMKTRLGKWQTSRKYCNRFSVERYKRNTVTIGSINAIEHNPMQLYGPCGRAMYSARVLEGEGGDGYCHTSSCRLRIDCNTPVLSGADRKVTSATCPMEFSWWIFARSSLCFSIARGKAAVDGLAALLIRSCRLLESCPRSREKGVLTCMRMNETSRCLLKTSWISVPRNLGRNSLRTHGQGQGYGGSSHVDSVATDDPCPRISGSNAVPSISAEEMEEIKGNVAKAIADRYTCCCNFYYTQTSLPLPLQIYQQFISTLGMGAWVIEVKQHWRSYYTAGENGSGDCIICLFVP